MESIATINVDHLIGNQIGSSTIIRELARGGMSIIFVAFQRTLKRQIAVKILPKKLITSKTASLFQQEAESAAILYHPNIIPIYEVGETDDFLFFTMQLVAGDTLSHLIKKAGKNIIPSRRFLPVERSIKMMFQILDALGYAHNQGIVHRDIKPGNILLDSVSNRPVVTDFGIAKVLRNDDDSKPIIQGTPVYMAPEQIVNRDVDGRADIYASGVMFYQMLVERLPLPRLKSTIALLKLKVKSNESIFTHKPSELNPVLHPAMDDIIFKATQKDIDLRYQTGREFIKDLEFYLKNYVN
ncbi:MAG: serine/threonine protein kinase [Proteobacteria bacterium]|nr:serine/threonine protein kinase [Pseudomonadota bacterium]